MGKLGGISGGPYAFALYSLQGVGDFVALNAAYSISAQHASMQARNRFKTKQLEAIEFNSFQYVVRTALQAGGRRFDPGHVHQVSREAERLFCFSVYVTVVNIVDRVRRYACPDGWLVSRSMWTHENSPFTLDAV